jgi:hypothetical protein
MMRDLQKK